jgi:hypothetical protein
MALGLNDFDASKSITHAIGKVDPKISTILGPYGTRFALCHFRAQKKARFQGPPLLMALVMDSARIKIITSRAL